MDSGELMSVAEYSIARGCSIQATYKRIAQGKLNDYLVLDGNRKMLRRQLLKDEGAIQPEIQPLNPDSTQPSKVEYSTHDVIIERLNQIERRLANIERILTKKPSNTKEKELTEPIQPEIKPWYKRLFGGD